MATKKEKKEEISQEEVLNQQEEKEDLSHPKLGDFRIIGGVCEFCGLNVKECPLLKEDFIHGKFSCLCLGSNNPDTFSQSIYKYWKKNKVWICNSEGCRRQVELLGGYKDPEILRFFLAMQ